MGEPILLFEDADHRNILLEDFDAGAGVPCNPHVIVDGKEAMILDPGGSKLFNKVFTATSKVTKGAILKHVFLSHQDPDIVAAINGWLMTAPKATGWVSELWRRFVPHFGSDRLVYERIQGIPDAGMRMTVGSRELIVLPAHYLHSCGNFHVYDPTAKILYTGDLGASIGGPDRMTSDLESLKPLMEGFHTRYMASNRSLRLWTAMVRTLDIEVIAPQHGAILQGREACAAFLDWLDTLEVGVDAHAHLYQVPG